MMYVMTIRIKHILMLLALAAGAASVGAVGLLTQRGVSETARQESDVRTAAGSVAAPLPIESYSTHVLTLSDGTRASFRVPEGFTLSLAAEGLGKARFMTRSPDGRLFVPDMVDYNLSEEGRVLVLSSWNETTKTFEQQDVYLEGLRGPHNVAFYTDEEGSEWLSLTLTEHLIRYPYRAGDRAPSGAGEVVYRFPNAQSAGASGTVWHVTRTAYFSDDTLYVAVGSGCNSCEEAPNEDRAVILAMDPDGTNARTYARGLRNAVGLAGVDGVLYATNNGADHLGPDRPNDALYSVEAGTHYGWPYCYEADGRIYADTSQTWSTSAVSCDAVPRALAAFEPHAAPLGLVYVHYSDAHVLMRNAFFVALQGAWDLSESDAGYSVVRVTKEGRVEVFVDGFLSADKKRIGRPVDVMVWSDGGILITDDHGGRLYHVASNV